MQLVRKSTAPAARAYELELVTSTRTYRFNAVSNEDREKWIAALGAVIDNDALSQSDGTETGLTLVELAQRAGLDADLLEGMLEAMDGDEAAVEAMLREQIANAEKQQMKKVAEAEAAQRAREAARAEFEQEMTGAAKKVKARKRDETASLSAAAQVEEAQHMLQDNIQKLQDMSVSVAPATLSALVLCVLLCFATLILSLP